IPGLSTIRVKLAPGINAHQWIATHSGMLGPTVDAETADHEIAGYRGFVAGFSSALTVIGLIVMLAGAYLAHLAMTADVAERTHLFGALHALGATRAQVRKVVISGALVVGLVASMAGAAIGVGIAHAIIASGRRQ